MLNIQKSTSDRTDLGYDFSSSNIVFSSTNVFVSPANNVEYENNDVKTVLASKNIDKGKSKCLSVKTLMSKCPKKNKTYTILIFIQVYSSNF